MDMIGFFIKTFWNYTEVEMQPQQRLKGLDGLLFSAEKSENVSILPPFFELTGFFGLLALIAPSETDV